MVALGKDMQLALDAHCAHLFPNLNRVHGCPHILVTVDEEHGNGLEVEIKFRHQDGTIVNAACGVVLLCSVGKGIGRIDTDAPLYVAGLLVEVVYGQIGLLHRGGHAHQGEMSARATSHDADIVGVETIIGCLALDHSNGTLQILPGGDMLLQTRLSSRTRGTIAHRHYRHAQAVEVAACRSHLESVGTIAIIASARVYNLDSLCLQVGRNVPLDVGRSLILLGIGHLAFRPDVLLNVFVAVVIVVEALHNLNLRSKRCEQ